MVSEITEGERAWLLAALDKLEAEAQPATRLSLPNWVWNDWVAQLGPEEALACGRSMLSPAGLDIRVNTQRAKTPRCCRPSRRLAWPPAVRRCWRRPFMWRASLAFRRWRPF